MDREDRRLFEQSIRAATSRASGPALDAALEELGWQDALAEDPETAVGVLFEEMGRTGVTSTTLAAVVGALLGPAAPTEGLLVLPRLGSWNHPGTVVGEGRIAVRGVGLRSPRPGERAVVVVPGPSTALVVDVPADCLTVREVRGLDPRMGLVELRSPAEGIQVDAGTAAPVPWERAVAAGRVAVAHQLVGAATAMLELARGHALERVQFGRPIASFQAVRHRLADSLLATETARSALTAAWDDRTPLTSGIAKAVAGRSARTVARHAQQVLAGMGFTAEHPFHLHLRRTLVLDELLGSSRVLTRELGVELLRTRRLPDLLPL